jgi:hypothetical protein
VSCLFVRSLFEKNPTKKKKKRKQQNSPQNVVPLVPQHPVHRRVIAYDHRVVQIRFRGRDAKLNQGNLGVLDPRRAPRSAGRALVEDEAVHELGVVDGAPQLGDDADVAEVDGLGAVGVDDWLIVDLICFFLKESLRASFPLLPFLFLALS